MATSGRFMSIQLTAGADLNTGGGTGAQYKAIAVGGTIAATSALSYGLIQNKPKNGEDLTVGYSGHMKGVAGAAIATAVRMMVTTSGYLITCTSGHVPVGKSLAAAASGATVECLFDFTGGGTISF